MGKLNKISVIIPALNEEAGIGYTLRAIKDEELLPGVEVEVIVADGGSEDRTCDVAARFAHKVVRSDRGRAVQMNAGAAAASPSSDIFFFMHSDCIIPRGAFNLIREALDKEEVAAGAFDLKIAHDSAWARAVEWMANRRSRLTGVPYGDQGLFMARETFLALGGFEPIPLMEDIVMGLRLSRMNRMGQIGRMAFIDTPMTASPRRWLEEGVLRTTLRDWALAFSFVVLKVPPERLARHYGDVR